VRIAPSPAPWRPTWKVPLPSVLICIASRHPPQKFDPRFRFGQLPSGFKNGIIH
jgi:hypothetical protein